MMSFSKFLFCLIILLALLGVSCVSKPIKKQEVIVRGVGTTLQEAKNDAIRQGIQFLVGSYVTSDLESMNEAITKDKVTEYSGAIVDRIEILDQQRRADGLYEMRARMRIAGDAQRQRNRAALSQPGQIDGKSLQAEALSRFKLQDDAEALWRNLLVGFPQRAFKYAVSTPDMNTIPNNREQVSLSFYSVTLWRTDFLKELRSVLNNTAHAVKADIDPFFRIIWLEQAPNYQQTGLCMIKGFNIYHGWNDIQCYIINLPSRHFDEWFCVYPGHKLAFDLQGVDVNGLEFINSSGKNIMPYLQVERNGYSSTFILFLVDDDMIQHRADYQELVSALWSVTVPVRALADLKNIRALGKCLNE
jgi:hypothetical protein